MLNEIYEKPLKNSPDKAAILFKEQMLSYRQLDKTTRQFATGLSSLGIGYDGRIKEVIIIGGSNVSPGEVEEVLDDHTDAAISGVVGVADEHYGELIHAFVEIKPGSKMSATVEQPLRYLSEMLATYKGPDRWTFLDKPPRNKAGKIDRARLHAMAREIDA